MELKRILAADVRAATEQAVKLYGDDVLIVSSHRVGTQAELVVAVDIAPEAPSKVLSEQRPQTDRPSQAPQECVVSQPLTASCEQEASLQYERVRSQEIVTLVREELADFRRELRLSQSWMRQSSVAACAPAVQPLAEQLHECAMPGALRALLIDTLQRESEPEQAYQVLRSQLISSVNAPALVMPAAGVHVLAGPSGVGKSTLAARLAQWGVQAFGAEQVALISYRDLRAGAWSQVQLLGAQAGVQVLRALDADTLELLLEELGTRALVVIDTPGVEMVQNVGQIMAVSPQAKVHAVLSADASSVNCQRVLKDSGLALTGLMLTKLDEADAPWALLQFLSHEAQAPARSLASRSDDLTQPLRIWSVQELVDNALRSSGLSGASSEVSAMSGTSALRAAQWGGWNA